MTIEDYELIFKDLSARLLYKVKINYNGKVYTLYECYLEDLFNKVKGFEYFRGYDIRNLTLKPYLRSMNSMTKVERTEYDKTFAFYNGCPCYTIESFDFLNAHHFDYRSLIKKELALEAPKEMYNS